jgi:MFS family permease
MYLPSERAGVFGWYLLGPLLGPTLGPLFGGTIVTRLGWRWIYYILAIVCIVPTAVGAIFLRETYVPVLLARRKANLLEEQANTNDHRKLRYHFEGEDTRPLTTKLAASMKRPLTIFVQPIVFTMSLYQAIIFATTYSIYTNMQSIFSEPPYNFTSEQIGLLYLGPGLGFLSSVWFLVPKIDTVYNNLTQKNNGKALPEYRLPLANIGSILIPAGLFWFAWSIEERLHFMISIAATFIYGIGQVAILNTTQNYYIDSFEKYAASAIAGGSVFRSLMGGVVPLFSPMLFDKVGYGWGISVFGFASVVVAPAPLVFYIYGERVRERFKIRF